jgi:tRNA-2-methylthio-N6-dimethylallyladenosine synthase
VNIIQPPQNKDVKKSQILKFKTTDMLSSLDQDVLDLNLKYYISTYGCQMNENDSERMASLLEMMNFSQANSVDDADLILINSCSVREKPVHKVHSEVGRYRKLKQRNPNLRIGVGGCVAQQEKDQLLKDIPVLDFVFGTDAIDTLPSLVNQVYKTKDRFFAAQFEHAKPYHIETLNRSPGVTGFINITKGCDNFCTFCVVPFTRGRERSRPYKDIIRDINSLTEKGVKEITLLGQNVNSYTSDCGVNFSNLLKGVAQETDIQRIRYTTSHPKDFTEELMKIHSDFRDKVCDYIHLPVQAGNSEVLARMNRGYTREDYIKKAKMIFDYVPGVSFSTDIIVGFPGETDEQFEETLSLIDEVYYESIYAFKYSPRPFTKAAKWEDQLTEDQKSERLQRLFDKHNEMLFKNCYKDEGQTYKVLVEKFDDNTKVLTGRTTKNKVAHFIGDSALVGQTVDVKIYKAFPQTLRGELV